MQKKNHQAEPKEEKKRRKAMMFCQSNFTDFKALQEKVTQSVGRSTPVQPAMTQLALMGCRMETWVSHIELFILERVAKLFDK